MTTARRAIVVGGGIVGLAVADRLTQVAPHIAVELLEKEDALALHQTGRNSGVIHSGLYYKPGSKKALNCRAGKALLEEFCERENVPFERCGKVVVATRPEEIAALDELARRGRANGVELERIGPERLRELEPHAFGLGALHVPESGIVDYSVVCERLAARIRLHGGAITTGVRASGITAQSAGVVVHTSVGDVTGDFAINCAGLFSDRVARASGVPLRERIVPFRGEYFELTEAARGLVKNLIYPTPDPRFPFLGVHFTRMIGGGVECGPNAVLALAREGYRWRDISLRDTFDALSYPGFLRLAARHWRTGLGEVVRSLSRAAFVRALRRLVPEVREEHLIAAPAGVRAQALDRRGYLVDDFVIEARGHVVHVLNAPSPAATSALEIARHVVASLSPSDLAGNLRSAFTR